ncbi:MAG: cytochrome b/b6 domain-containing protein [Thiobacillaceae bacterium]
MESIRVWDLPTRLGHWLLAATFLLAWISGDSETWRLIHVLAGGAFTGVVGFRIVWGLVGSRHARFGAFVRHPAAALAYLRGLLTGDVQHYTGHNPAGAYAILALLGLGLLSGASGWLSYQEIGGEWLAELHEGLANTLVAVVLVHLAGVAVGSLAHRENLIRAMLTGYKRGPPDEAISANHWWGVILLLSWSAFVAWWMAR